jgi:hypothetical protein
VASPGRRFESPAATDILADLKSWLKQLVRDHGTKSAWANRLNLVNRARAEIGRYAAGRDPVPNLSVKNVRVAVLQASD